MIKHLARMVVAYLAASIAAGVTFALTWWLFRALVALIQTGHWELSHMAPLARIAVMGVWASIFVAMFAFVPAVVTIAIAEVRGVRLAAFYGGAGVVAAMVALAIYLTAGGAWRLLLRLSEETVILALHLSLVGLIAGLVYWCIAGRRAGECCPQASGPHPPRQ